MQLPTWVRVCLRCEELFIYLLALQISLGIFTLVLLQRGMIRGNDIPARMKSAGDQTFYPLREDSERHARKLFAEISRKAFYVPVCTEFRSVENFCDQIRESLSQLPRKATTLKEIHSEIFASCLELVQRLFKSNSATAPLVSYSPSQLDISPFVNLGDFIFTAERQWIPTECKNATKVAVIIFDDWSDQEMWKYTLIRNFILQLQRISVHFGVFVIKHEDLMNLLGVSTDVTNLILNMFSGWDQVFSVSFYGKDVSCNIHPTMINSLYHHTSSIKYQVNGTSNIAASPQYLFTNILAFQATKTTRRRPSRSKKPWRLSNLMSSRRSIRTVIQVAESWPVPEQ